MNYVRVVINGESWGVYLNAQQFNERLPARLLQDHRRARAGRSRAARAGAAASSTWATIRPRTSGSTRSRRKDDPESWQALIQLTRVLNQTPPDKLEAALAPILDIDGALRFLALEVALVNSDGYWTRASDYNFYRDPEGGSTSSRTT